MAAEPDEAEPQLAGASILIAISRVWSQVTTGITFLATSIAITPSEFGEFAIAMSIFSALTVCVGQGTFEYVIKARDSDRAAPTVFLLNVASAIFVTLLTLVIAHFVPMIVPGQHIGRILLLMIPAFFLIAVSALMESVVMKRGAIKQVAQMNLVSDTTSLVVAMAALALGAGLYSLVIQRLVRESMALVAYGLFNKWRPRFLLDRVEAKRAIAFAKSIVGIRLIGMGSTALTDVTIGAMLGPSEAGVLRLVARLLNVGHDVLFQPFRAALWVRLPPLQNNVPAFRKTMLELIEIYGIGMFAVMTGMALIAQPAFSLAFKPEWAPAIPIMGILAAGRLIGILTAQSEVVFALRDRMGMLVRTSIISSLLGILVVLLTARLGLTTYAFATVGAGLLMQLYVGPQVAWAVESPIMVLLKLMGRLALNGLALLVVVGPLLFIEAQLGAPAWLQLASAVVAGAPVYILSASRLTPVGFKAYKEGAERIVAASARHASTAMARLSRK